MFPVDPFAAVSLVALACAVWRLLATCHTPYAALCAVLAPALPMVLLNAGQHAFMAALCIMALDGAIRRRPARMLMWYGGALAVAPAALLLMPFIAAALLAHRVSPSTWLLAVSVIVSGLAIYVPAANTADALAVSRGAPNLWRVAQALFPADAPGLVGLALAGAIGAAACYIAHFSVRLPTGGRMLPAALFATLVTTGLLPNMTPGSFLLASLIAPVWAVVSRERHAWQAAVLIEAGSLFALGGPAAGAIGFACVAVATWLVAMPTIQPAANDNPLRMPARQTAMPRAI